MEDTGCCGSAIEYGGGLRKACLTQTVMLFYNGRWRLKVISKDQGCALDQQPCRYLCEDHVVFSLCIRISLKAVVVRRGAAFS